MKENKYVFEKYGCKTLVYKQINRDYIKYIGTLENILYCTVSSNNHPIWTIQEKDVLKTPEEYYGY